MAYDFSKLKILVVEESQPMMQILCSLLKDFGVQNIDIATTSANAFKKLQQEKYDLLLLDWLIAPYNGIDLTEKVRMDTTSRNPFIPVILMTGFSEKKRVVTARDKGVTEFLAKPFTANDLYKRIEHIIEKPRQFVKAPGFFGPDRRRKVIRDKKIPKRRAADKVKND